MQGSEIGREAEEIVKSGGEFATARPSWGLFNSGCHLDWFLYQRNSWCSFRPCRRMFLFVGLVSDELMLKIIQSELDKLHGKASPPSLASFIPSTPWKSFQTTSDSISYIAHPMTSHFSPPINQSWILDGFPRTLRQADLLDSALNAQGRPLNMIIHLRVPDSVILQRISGESRVLRVGRVQFEEEGRSRKRVLHTRRDERERERGRDRDGKTARLES